MLNLRAHCMYVGSRALMEFFAMLQCAYQQIPQRHWQKIALVPMQRLYYNSPASRLRFKGTLTCQATQKKASETRTVLSNIKAKPKKSLGQNFVVDDSVLRRIVAAARLEEGDLVLEVGPGTGNLTRHILSMGAHVTAVEKDDTLHDALLETMSQALNTGFHAQESRLKLVHGDVLRVDLPSLLEGMVSAAPASDGQARVKVVANLPYNISSDFLKLILPQSQWISDLYLMLQDEVATRIALSAPRASDYRAMSVYVNFYSRPAYLFKISRQAFFPVPGVDSALTHFRLIPAAERPPVDSEKRLWALVRAAFSQKRKSLRNSLKPLFDGDVIVQALEGRGLLATARAAELGVDDYVALYRVLDGTVRESGDGGGLGQDVIDLD